MTLQIRPLGKVKQMVESIGMGITYAYDDLVFSDHSMFIIRFVDDNPSSLLLYFNIDCDSQESLSVEKKLEVVSLYAGFSMKRMGTFEIQEVEGKESINILFY